MERGGRYLGISLTCARLIDDTAATDLFFSVSCVLIRRGKLSQYMTVVSRSYKYGDMCCCYTEREKQIRKDVFKWICMRPAFLCN